MQGLYPEVGTSGIIKVDKPYDKLVSDRIMYECVAVESIDGLIAAGYSPYDEFYYAHGAPSGSFERDLGQNGKIVTFRSSDGVLVKVPNSFILSLPNADGYVYQSTSLGITLSPIPEELDLTSVMSEIEQLLMVRLGISATIEQVLYGPDVLLSQEQHLAIKAVRAEASTSKESYLLQLLETKRALENAKSYIQRLERHIENIK